MNGGWVRLGDVSVGRDNNLNLIRMVAALSVVVSHAWPLALGYGTIQPLETLLGVQLGSLAVYVFFAISGFLVARSYDRQPSVADWISARVLRIFPGLATVLVAAALVLGPLMTSLPLREYLSSSETFSYAPRGLTLGWRQYVLPGVFEGNPYGPNVNGSLWTLYYEVACYGVVLCLGLAGVIRSRLATLAILALLNLGVLLAPTILGPDRLQVFLSLLLPFGWGAALYVVRDHVPLSPWILLGLLGLTAVASLTPLYPQVAMMTLAYGVFVLAYLPGGWIRRYNALGDYSYGVYIYGWPVQQAMVQALGPMTPLQNIAATVPVLLVLAWLSWTLVEKPSLGLLRRSSRFRPARRALRDPAREPVRDAG